MMGYQQCNSCKLVIIDGSKKPPYSDYFLCLCYGKRKTIGNPPRDYSGFGPELYDWYDVMCLYCAEEKNYCRTCGIELLDEDDSSINTVIEF